MALNAFPPSANGSFNCLEAMRAQSPPRTAEDPAEFIEDAMAAQYSAWKGDHPSAIDEFEKLMEFAEGKKIAVFLDYDGTLSPIVEDPDKAYMSETMREAVKNVASHFPTAIISGRGREKVYDFVQLSELYYAGSHGMDIMGPANGVQLSNGAEAANGTTSYGTDIKGNGVTFFQPASEYYPVMNEVCEKLKGQARAVEGALVENNKFCITVHFRRVQQDRWEALADIVAGVLKDYPRLRTTHGRKVLEVRPAVDWNKGKALSYLLKALGLEKVEKVLPLYIGDDRTDEDAFSVLKDREMGFGILVSTIAKATHASYSLKDPAEVMTFLNKLVKWRENNLKESSGG